MDLNDLAKVTVGRTKLFNLLNHLDFPYEYQQDKIKLQQYLATKENLNDDESILLSALNIYINASASDKMSQGYRYAEEIISKILI